MKAVRLRHLAAINPAVPEFDQLPDDADVTFVPLECIWRGPKLDTTRRRPKSDVATGFTRFREGDILVPKITPTFETNRSTIAHGLAHGVACGTTELHVVRPGPDLDTRFALYALSSRDFLAEGTASMTGVAGQQRIPTEFLMNFRVPLPDLRVQRAIADFLDSECGALDHLIQQRHRVMDLQDESLAASIDRAMSMLSHDPRWRMKHLLQRPLQYGAAEPLGHEEPTWPRYIRTTDIDTDGLLRPETFRSLSPDVARDYMLDDGDLLFTRSGATVGKSFMYSAHYGPACFAGYLIRATVDRAKAMPAFLAYFARSTDYWQQIGGTVIQATIQNVNAERYGDLRLPVPPLDKQSEIVGIVDAVSRRTLDSKTLMTSQERRLEERRQVLIDAALTGQISVPGAA